MAPTWNDEFELPDGSYSVSDIRDSVEYIIKNHETLTTIPPIQRSLVKPVISSVVKGISGRGVRRAGRGYTDKNFQFRLIL